MPPIQIITTVEDRKGKQASTGVNVADTTTRTQLDSFALGWVTLIDNLVSGIIRSVFAVIGVDISAITNNTPSASSDVEEVGAFEFVTAEGNRVKFNIPAINENLVTNETGELDQTQTAIANLITLFEDGFTTTGGNMSPCDIGEDDIVGVIYARERFRNSGARKVN